MGSRASTTVVDVATNGNTEGEQMVTIPRGILREFECPVCFNYMVSLISMCVNGHSTCGECRTTLQLCPLCNGPFVDARNLVLENVIKGIKYPCINANNGCTETFPADQIKNHEASCLKGRIKCPMNKFPNTKCDWIGHVKEIEAHALENPTTHVSVLQNPFSSNENHAVTRLVFVFDEIFLYYKINKGDNWYFIVMLVGNAAQASKYKSTFTLSENNGPNKFVFTTDVKHHNEDFDVILNNWDCCQIHKRVAKKCVHKTEVHEILNMTVEIATNN